MLVTASATAMGQQSSTFVPAVGWDELEEVALLEVGFEGGGGQQQGLVPCAATRKHGRCWLAGR